MKKLSSLLLLVIWLLPFLSPAADIQNDPEVMKQVGQILQQIQHIQVGMTRADVEKLFTPAGGGFRPIKTQTYEYKSCGYIKVDVDFISRNKNDSSKWKQDDVIISISKPYLDFIVYD